MFQDFDELVTRPPKRLPIGGVVYDFPDRVSAQTGLVLLALQRQAFDEGIEGLQDGDALMERMGGAEGAERVYDELLGDAGDQLIAAGYGAARPHIIKTLIVWHLSGEDAASKAWAQMGPTPAPNRAARRAPAKKAPAKPAPKAKARKASGR